MARPKTKTADQATGSVDPQIAAQMSADANALIAIKSETEENARALAEQLGYAGTLTAAGVEDEIRFYQRRTVEDCLELGTRLLLLRELTPHGEFGPRLDALQLDKRIAQRLMNAALKFTKSVTKPLLTAAGNQTKLLELVVLDDEEIADLAAGGSARGINLDTVEAMSVTELRKALRESQADAEAKDRVLADKSKKVDELAQQLARPFKPKKSSPAKTAEDQAALDELTAATHAAEVAFARLGVVVTDLQQHEAEAMRGRALQAVQYLVVAMRDIVLQNGLEVSVSDDALGVAPAWLKPLDNAAE